MESALGAENAGSEVTFPIQTGVEELPGPVALPQAASPRDLDELWIVSTRRLGNCRDGKGALKRLDVRRHHNSRWRRSSFSRLLTPDDQGRTTVVWIHGNRVPASRAVGIGKAFYQRLVAAPTANRPLRFVIWSWPTDQIRGPLRDARSKAARSDVDGYYLAEFLRSLPPTDDVAITGYSFGARVVTSALHLMGGGKLFGRKLQDNYRRPFPYRVVLMAAAVNNNWLLPGHAHGRALEQTEKMLSLYNSHDEALRLYRFVSRHSHPAALGYTGICGHCQLHEYAARFEQINVACAVGSEHDWRRYVHSRMVMDQTRSVVFSLPIGALSQADVPSTHRYNAVKADEKPLVGAIVR